MADRIPSGASASGAATRAHSSPTCTSSLTDRAPRSLAVDAEDNAGELRTALQAYCAIEKLIACHGAQDNQGIVADRDEMSALLRLMNEHLAQRLDTLNTTLQALHSGLRARETLQ